MIATRGENTNKLQRRTSNQSVGVASGAEQTVTLDRLLMNRLAILFLSLAVSTTAFAEQPDNGLTLSQDSLTDGETNTTYDHANANMLDRLNLRTNPPRVRRVRRVKRVRRQPVEVVRPTPTPAPQSNLGPYFTLGGIGHFIIDDVSTSIDNAYNGGGGFLIGIGFRILPMVALEANWMASFQSTSVQTNLGRMPVNTIHSLNLDAKIFYLPWSRRIEPFLQLGVGAYMLSETFDYELSGFGLDVGGGVDIRLSDSVGLGLKALYRGFFVDNTDENYYVYLQREAAFVDSITVEATLQFYF